MDGNLLFTMVLMIAVFYFLLIRPENKRKKQAEDMRSSIKKGERITTIGGIVGKVVQVNDTTIVLETSEDRVRMEIAKWGVQSTESSEQAQQGGGLFGFGGFGGKKKAADAPQESQEIAKTEEKTDFDPEIK